MKLLDMKPLCVREKGSEDQQSSAFDSLHPLFWGRDGAGVERGSVGRFLVLIFFRDLSVSFARLGHALVVIQAPLNFLPEGFDFLRI
ncbi:MAG: hypothetical protein WB999_11990, partial [Candidatus Binataceae bacterium]